MAKKDFDEYYDKIAKDYYELLDTLKEMEKEVMTGSMPPEALDNLKKMITPIKDSYMTLAYVVFLLNQPVRKKKIPKYNNMNKKFLSKIEKEYSPENTVKKCDETLEEIKHTHLT